MLYHCKIVILVTMGSQPSVPVAAKIYFPGPHLIETGEYTTKVSLENYNTDELLKRDIPSKELPEIKKIIMDRDYQASMPQNFHKIHFHNRNCESILEVTNENSSFKDKVMAIRLSD